MKILFPKRNANTDAGGFMMNLSKAESECEVQ